MPLNPLNTEVELTNLDPYLIQEKSREIITQIFNGQNKKYTKRSEDPHINILSDISNIQWQRLEQEEYSDITSHYQKLVHLFLSELLIFLQEKYNTASYQTYAFGQYSIDQTLFNYDPNLFDVILDYKLLLKYSNHYFQYNKMSIHLSYRFVEIIEYHQINSEELINHINSLPLSLKLKTIRFLFQTYNLISSDYACASIFKKGLELIDQTIFTIKQNNKIPFIQYCLNNVEGFCKQVSIDEIAPHIFVYYYNNQPYLLIRDKSKKLSITEVSNNYENLSFQNYAVAIQNPQFSPLGKNLTSEDIKLMQEIHTPKTLKALEKDLGCNLFIPLEQQIHLMFFLADKTTVTYERLKKILAKNPEHKGIILSNFLSCAKELKYGNTILNIAEYLNVADPQLINLALETINKVSELITSSQETAQLIKQYYQGSLEINPQIIHKMMLEQSWQLLDKTKRAIQNKNSIEIKAILKEIDQTKISILAFGYLFKYAKEQGSVDFNQFGMLQKITQSSEQEKRMLEIYDKNYQDHPGLIVDLTETFKSFITTPDSRFNILSRSKEIIGFIASRVLDPENPDPAIRYIGAFNIDTLYQHFGIGGAFFINFLKNEFNQGATELHGIVEINSANHIYYKKLGFIDQGKPYRYKDKLDVIDIILTPKTFNPHNFAQSSPKI